MSLNRFKTIVCQRILLALLCCCSALVYADTIEQAFIDTNLPRAKQLLAEGANPDADITNGDFEGRLIHVAAEHGASWLSELLPYQPALNVLDSFDRSALHIAAAEGNAEAAALLLAAGAAADITNSQSETPLFWAISNDAYQVAALLVEAGANINHESASLNVLNMVGYSESYFTLENLLWLAQHGASPTMNDGSGRTLLSLIVMAREGDAYSALVALGDTWANDPLVTLAGAIQNDDVAAFQAGFNPQQLGYVDMLGSSWLHLAIAKDAQGVSEYLLEQGARLDVYDYDGFRPLDLLLEDSKQSLLAALMPVMMANPQHRFDVLMGAIISSNVELWTVWQQQASAESVNIPALIDADIYLDATDIRAFYAATDNPAALPVILYLAQDFAAEDVVAELNDADWRDLSHDNAQALIRQMVYLDLPPISLLASLWAQLSQPLGEQAAQWLAESLYSGNTQFALFASQQGVPLPTGDALNDMLGQVMANWPSLAVSVDDVTDYDEVLSDAEVEKRIAARRSQLQQKQHASEALIGVLIEAGADVTATDASGDPLLFSAVSLSDTLWQQLTAGIDLSQIKNADGDGLLPALMTAAPSKALRLLEDIPAALRPAWSEHMMAADMLKQTALRDALWRKGAGLDAFDEQGFTLLHRLYAAGDFKELQRFITQRLTWLSDADSQHALLNTTDLQGQSLLFKAIKDQHINLAEFLVNNGASWLTGGGESVQPVTALVAQKQEALLNLALADDIRMQQADPMHRSLLQRAVAGGSVSVVKWLLAAKADPAYRDKLGRSAFDHAIMAAYPDVIDVFKTLPVPADNRESLFSDPRVIQWSLYVMARDTEGALELIEKDLRSGNPHPFAEFAWIKLTDNLEQLPASAELLPAGLRDILTRPFNIDQAITAQNFALVQQLMPVEDVSHKDLFWVNLLAQGLRDIDGEEQGWPYLEKAARLDPLFWQTAWNYINDDWLNSAAFQARAMALAGTPEVKDTLLASYIQLVIKAGAIERVDRMALLREWVATTGDPRAATALNYDLAGNYYYDEALAYAQIGVIRSPFYSNRDQVTRKLLRVDRDAQAVRWSELTAHWYHGNESDADRAIRYTGDAYRLVGDKGTAREYLNSVAGSDKVSHLYWQAMARLEEADERDAETLAAWRKAVNLNPQKNGSTGGLLKHLLKMERLSEASSLFDTLRSTGWPTTFSDYDDALETAKALKDNALFATLLDDAVTRFPESVALQTKQLKHALSQQSLTAKHLEQARLLLTRRPDNKALIDLWYQVSQQLEGDAKTLVALRTLTQQRPALINYWKKLAAVSANSDEQKLAFWQEATQTSPAQFGLKIQLISQAVNNKDYSLSLQTLADAGQTTDALLPSQQADIWLYHMWTLERISEAGELDSTLQEAFAEALANYRQQQSSLFDYWRYMESLQRAAGDMQAAANALYAKGELNRDNTSTYHDLIARYSDQLSNKQRHGFGVRMLQRNPFSASHYNSYLHKALRWGAASAVTALKVIEEGRRKGVAVNDTYEQLARDQLGDSLAGFLRYKNFIDVGASQRYLDWFTSARRDALFKENRQIIYHLEGDFPKVEIVMPDGQVVHREDDARFGKMRKISRGAAYIQADYDHNGNVLKIETSAGDLIQLGYNLNNKISSLFNGETKLLFGYNQDNKMNFIQQVGVGSVHVRYRGNEIENVESAGGHKMVLKITQMFQQLTGLVKSFSQAADPDDLPELALNDPTKDALQQAYDEADWESRDWYQAGLNLAAYLLDHLSDNPDYAWQIQNLTEQVFFDLGEQSDMTPAVANGITLWWQLQHRIRPHGVDADDFATAQTMLLWSNSREGNNASRQLQQLLASQPVKRLPNTNWLARNALSNEGYWYREANKQLFADTQPPAITAMLRAANGDVYLGTDKGLLLRHQGYWSWLIVEPRSATMVRSSEPDTRSALSITALAQTADGTVWLGTRNGVIALDESRLLTYWQTAQQGMLSASVDALLASANRVWVANGKQVLQLSTGQAQAEVVATANEPVTQLFSGPDGMPLVIAGGQLGMVMDGDIRSFNQRAESALWWADAGQIWWWDGRQMKAADWQGQFHLQPTLRADQSILPMSKRVFGLTLYAPPALDAQPMVLTDQGVALWRDSSFESLSLPYQDARGGLQIGAHVMAQSGEDLLLATDDGVYSFQPSRSQRLDMGKVRDMVYIAPQKMTFLATDRGLFAIPDSDDAALAAPIRLSNIRPAVLAVTPQGDLLANDGLTLLKFAPGSFQGQELFRAEQSVEDNKYTGPLQDILADADGTIWVVAGSSVFRWRDKEEVQEYNYFVDAEQFPARSDMLTRVYRDIEGDLYVVASNEGHRYHQSVRLSGGLLKYQGNGFTRVENYQDRPWFVTAYTKVAEDKAVLATDGQFALQQFGSIQSFTGLDDPSYKQMREQAPMIFLGGTGAQLGDQPTWLFPSAGGVLVYHNQQWFYPDRINRLLPQDQALGQYGGRAVSALTTDSQGRVYVGTDLGVLVYQAGDAASLLTDHQRGDLAFIDQANQTQQAMQSIFLNKFPADSEQGKLIRQYRDLQQQVEQLSQQQKPDQQTGTIAQAPVAGMSTEDADALAKELRRKERQRQRLLAELEKEHYGLYQMLKLDPREIAAMHRQLEPDQVLVQYLPTPDRLLIQVVTRAGAQIREVDVTQQQLQQDAQQLAGMLRQRALQLNPTQRGFNKTTGVQNTPQALSAQITQKLASLYDVLLRPVEQELSNKQQVYLTPVGALTYVPFSALVRQAQGHIEYAAERFNLGVLPSMYHFSLIMQQDASFAEKALFISDPDGSLPGARKEVDAISQRYPYENEILLGDKASMDELSFASQDSRLIHFATHGVMDEANPADSYLVMANGERLGVIDIAMLDLKDTDIVVLSACDSGVGSQGLEYATLARAFAHAKVPSVVASYWAVNDTATSELMQALYTSLEDPDADLFESLAKAQRQLIKQGGDLADPSAWAAFSVFGKP